MHIHYVYAVSEALFDLNKTLPKSLDIYDVQDDIRTWTETFLKVKPINRLDMDEKPSTNNVSTYNFPEFIIVYLNLYHPLTYHENKKNTRKINDSGTGGGNFADDRYTSDRYTSPLTSEAHAFFENNIYNNINLFISHFGRKIYNEILDVYDRYAASNPIYNNNTNIHNTNSKSANTTNNNDSINNYTNNNSNTNNNTNTVDKYIIVRNILESYYDMGRGLPVQKFELWTKNLGFRPYDYLNLTQYICIFTYFFMSGEQGYEGVYNKLITSTDYTTDDKYNKNTNNSNYNTVGSVSIAGGSRDISPIKGSTLGNRLGQDKGSPGHSVPVPDNTSSQLLTIAAVATNTLHTILWRGDTIQVSNLIRNLCIGRVTPIVNIILAIRDKFAEMEINDSGTGTGEIPLDSVRKLILSIPHMKLTPIIEKILIQIKDDILIKQHRHTIILPEIYIYFSSIIQTYGESTLTISEIFTLLQHQIPGSELCQVASYIIRLIDKIISDDSNPVLWKINTLDDVSY